VAKKVILETAGGMAATFAAPPTVVDEHDLDDDARQHLQHLVGAVAAPDANAADADTDGPGQLRDARSYQITIEDADGRTVVLSATDGTVSPQFAQLRDWIRENGRTQP
jgi:hypothetical protein